MHQAATCLCVFRTAYRYYRLHIMCSPGVPESESCQAQAVRLRGPLRVCIPCSSTFSFSRHRLSPGPCLHGSFSTSEVGHSGLCVPPSFHTTLQSTALLNASVHLFGGVLEPVRNCSAQTGMVLRSVCVGAHAFRGRHQRCLSVTVLAVDRQHWSRGSRLMHPGLHNAT